MNNDICWTSASDLAEAIRNGDLSATEVASAMVARIEDVNPAVNAFVSFDPEQVLADARALDKRQADGEELGPLHGVPYSIKELTAMKDLPLTLGLAPLKGNLGARDAAFVTRMRGAGGLFLGKTNAPECAYYGGTDGHLYGPTHNPWKHGYSAGGSSGGAAAAVAAGMGPLAEGSDGAGSVRIPAALCGVVGMKPSMGRVPQSMLPGRFYTWAHHGPITRTVRDAALMMNVVAGPDTEDPLSLPADGTDYLTEIGKDLKGWRVAWSPDLGLGYIDPEVERICRDAAGAFEQLGATVTEATPAWGNPEEAMWHGVWLHGYASVYDMLDWESMQGQVDDNLIALMKEAKTLTAIDIGRADVLRGATWDAFAGFMHEYDILVSPTLSSATFPLEQFAPDWLAGEPLRRQLLGWLLTYPFNMTGTPAITVPAGFTADGRPVGLQIAGRLHADASVLRAAANFESVRPWAARRPENHPEATRDENAQNV
ncbi:amidase [Streptomyces olivoreticuli]|uniref:amidase n=1 Tax=Streptomyces olivoreticuli TaxID=68246 RepID=UPI000E241874|nr:amidase family protein [Streptomyces olivoreticuli]